MIDEKIEFVWDERYVLMNKSDFSFSRFCKEKKELEKIKEKMAHLSKESNWELLKKQNLIRELKETEIKIINDKIRFIETRARHPETQKIFSKNVLYKYRYKVSGKDASRIIGMRFDNKFYVIAFYFKNAFKNIL